MKKIALVLALLLIFSLLASCNEGDTPPEVTTTVATTTAATTTAKPAPTDGITVGMSRDKVIERLDDYVVDYPCFGMESPNGLHIYFVDSNGDNVVVTMTPNTSNRVGCTHSHEICDCAAILIVYGVVESVFRCPPVEKPQLSLDELLQTKLTPEEALEKLGMPWDPHASSYMGIHFNTSDNRSGVATFDLESGTYYFISRVP